MFDIFNLLYVGFNVITMTMYPKVSERVMMNFTDVNQVITIDLKREWWREDGRNNCTFHAVLVPYVQDWTDTVRRGKNSEEITIAAKPDEVAGHALLVTSKECDNLKKTPILFGTDMTWQRTVVSPSVDNYMNLSEGQKPKWFDQVIARLDSVAVSNPEVKAQAQDLHHVLNAVAEAKKAGKLPEASAAQ